MNILNVRFCMLLVSVGFIAGCGKQERMEAVQFSKVLGEKKAVFANASRSEQELISSAQAWCGGITANGAGRGVELEQNASVAGQLAKSAVAISNQLSEVRQAIDGQVLTEEYPRGVRNELIGQLTKRQRRLQDLRALLEQAGPQFLEYQGNKAYKGDSYPDGIGKLDPVLRASKDPPDSLGAAIAALKTKYGLNDNEL